MRVLFLGDSLTRGSIGYSFADFLPSDIQVINKGVNGDTTRGARDRLMRYITTIDCDSVVVCIGANDVLLPAMGEASLLWRPQMRVRCYLRRCATTDEDFAHEYGTICELLMQSGKNTVLMGLPHMEMKEIAASLIERRNEIIAQLAEKYGFPYIDSGRVQREEISQRPGAYGWAYSQPCRLADGVIMTLFPRTKRWYAQRRRRRYGLKFTVDGVHLNQYSARALAQHISDVLSQ